MDEREVIKIAPQAGPQTAFLSSLADIAFFGGAAGSGKSFALLLEPLRHHNNPKFGGVIFRKQATQVRNEGGLWHESHQLYPLLGAKPREMTLEWNFPSGARMKFAHLEHEKTVLEYQGSQIPYIGFDEITHFSSDQFWYMLSRNRSASGVRSYIRGTCNADAESWVRPLIDWWIGPDGFPIKDRSGVLRWFIKQGNEIIWADSREELTKQYGEAIQPKSFTFISALLQDNKILMDKDPGYLANLLALNRVERARLLEGNWNTKPSAGNYFKREYFPIIGQVTNATVVRQIRYWDRASTKPNEGNKNPDYTVGIKLGVLNTGAFIILHMVETRDTPLQVENLVKTMALHDGYECEIGLEQDPGSAGASDISHMTRILAGYNVRVFKPTKDKITRCGPVSSQAEHGNILMIKGRWNDSLLMNLENFPPDSTEGHDDHADALSGAFNAIAQTSSILDVL